MPDNTIAYFKGQIQSFSIIYQKINNPQAMDIVTETTGMQFIQRGFPSMAKGSMAKVMGKSNRLYKGFVEAQGGANGSGYLRDFEHMGQPSSIMVTSRCKKNLGLVLESTECFTMDNPIPVLLNRQTEITD